jgi:predicted ABC-class ATPase
LTVLSVPADALAGPARLRLTIDRGRAGLDVAWSRTPEARPILEDAIIRAAIRAIEELPGPPLAAAPGSGRLSVAVPGTEIVERTTARVGATELELMLSFDLPAIVRRARAEQAAEILFDRLPRLGMAALLFPLRRVNDLKPRVEAAMRRHTVAAALPARGLAALIPSAALPGHVLPPGLRVSVESSQGAVAGAGLPRGVTLVVGAGVAGAGPWLRGLEAESGTSPGGTAIFAGPVGTVRASRRVFGPIDLSAFVRACPEVPRPELTRAEDAPSPLAVAASIVGAVEAGATVLLIDEDDLPAGALGCDGRMQRILGETTPALVPLIDRLADLRERWGLSVIIAARAIGDLCEVADTVLVLHEDRLEDVTEAARRIARATATFRSTPALASTSPPPSRQIRIVTDGTETKVGLWGSRGVRVGDDLVDLSDTTSVRDAGRLRAVAVLLKRAAALAPKWLSLDDLLDQLESAGERDALTALEEPGLWDLARPSRLEIADALGRWKRVAFRAAPGTLRQPAD